jgi:hypothetical protein
LGLGWSGWHWTDWALSPLLLPSRRCCCRPGACIGSAGPLGVSL